MAMSEDDLKQYIKENGEPTLLEIMNAVGEIASDVGTLREQVAKMAELLPTAADDTKAKKPQVVSWIDLDQDELADELNRLADWLYDVLFELRPETRNVIPSCWIKHWNVVDELGVLHAVWEHAYRWDKSNPSAAAEYLDRWLVKGVERIRDFTKATCTADQHLKRQGDMATNRADAALAIKPERPAGLSYTIGEIAATRKIKLKEAS